MFTNNGIIPYLAKNDEEMRAINGRTQIGIIEAKSNQFNSVCTYEWKKCLQIIDLLLTWRKTI